MKNITVSSLLKKYKIRPKKNLGQNFLVNTNLMNKLMDPLDLYPDEDLLEIGSGLGVFSSKLARHALGVLAIEKDRRLIEIARQEFVEQKNLKFVEGDFLKLDLESLLRNLRLPIKVIGNIPYNISSPILFKLLENHSLFQLAVLTVQKEVAKRLVAAPGSKDYGVLTVLLNSQVCCESLFDLEAGAFLPPPEVTSTAVKISFPNQPLHNIYNPTLFKRVVKTAFNQRRKTVRNTLKTLLKNNKIKPWEACAIDPNSRPERLTIAQYVTLANFLGPLL